MGRSGQWYDDAAMAILIPLRTPPARISPKVRHAVDLMVREGRKQTDAAAEAGMSRQGLHKALKRVAVRDLVDSVRLRFIEEAEGKRAWTRARSIEVALDLMLNAKSEAIRARRCEFLVSDVKVSTVAVHIDARQAAPASGYRYVRPGEASAEAIDGE